MVTYFDSRRAHRADSRVCVELHTESSRLKKISHPSNKIDSEDYTECMMYEVRESEDKKGEFLALAIDNESRGEEYIALFSGPKARERAEEYVAWKNSEVDGPKVAPQSR